MNDRPVHVNETIAGISQKESTKLRLDDSLWLDCSFAQCVMEGADLGDSLFIRCGFEEVDWYWCQAYRSTFVECRFHSCDLRGNFDEARFIKCHFDKCMTGHDNLGGKTEWKKAIDIDCVTRHCRLPIIGCSDDG